MSARSLAAITWLGCGLASVLAGGASATVPTPRAVRAEPPLRFEENVGQWEPRASFAARTPGGVVLLTPGCLHAVSADTGAGATITFLGSHSSGRVEGVEPLPGRTNYLRGSDPSRWRTGARGFARVRCHDAWPGIDIDHHGQGRAVEQDFLVAPGADPSAIRLGFDGVADVAISVAGDLVLATPAGELRLLAPVAWQDGPSGRDLVGARFVIRGDCEAGVAVDTFDRSRPLVIDPVLAYSTFFGGSESDEATGLAVDAAGSPVLVGYTQSTDFPVSVGALQPMNRGGFGGLDGFVSKLTADGQALVFSTYFGGTADDSVEAVTIDASGRIVVVGWTSSTDFPVVRSLQAHVPPWSDAFVAVLSADGATIEYCTYLGGTSGEYAGGVDLGPGGEIFVAGLTTSADYPTLNPFQPMLRNASYGNVFVTKLDAAGSGILYSTFIGSSEGEQSVKLGVDDQGRACIAGVTRGTDFPLKNELRASCGFSDSFVAKLDASGSSLVYSTYLCGRDQDSINALAVDDAGNAYVTGETRSNDFPLQDPIQPLPVNVPSATEVFVTKIDPLGQRLVWSTYLGGDSGDFGSGIGVDAAGNVHVTGTASYSATSPFPTARPFQPLHGGGGSDFFVLEIDAAGSRLVYSSFLGRQENDTGRALAVDGLDKTWITGRVSDGGFFPTVDPYQPRYGGRLDAMLARIDDAPALPETDCSNGADDDGDGLTDCADTDCRGSVDCPELNCANGADDDGDRLVDCADPDCVADPLGDCDGDGAPNGVDCLPADPAAFARPPEVDRLMVVKPLARPTEADLTWTDMAPRVGTGLNYDVVTGLISALWEDRGFANAACLALDVVTTGLSDARLIGGSGGFYYLVRVENACGSGSWGADSFGTPRAVPPACN